MPSSNSPQDTPPADDVIWGAKAIGLVIGRSERQTYHLLEQGHLSCARKFGSTWVSTRSALLQLFSARS
jgi:hypothetical protein